MLPWHTFKGSCQSPFRAALAICLLILALAAASPTYATGATWTVDRASDDATDGDVSGHRGSLRFALAHASSGDLVQFGDIGVDSIFLNPQNGTLVVPAGVAIGGRRNQPSCGSYDAPLVTIEDPALAPASALPAVISLGAGATLRNVAILRGLVGVRITGPNAEVCGVGIGRTVGGDGDPIASPPWHAALVVDADHAIVRRSYINGQVSVTANGSDSRIGDTVGGDGDGNAGVRDAYISILAAASGAAQRVTVRDPFPRGLSGMAGTGVPGGDDDPKHANNWAQTPTIASARSADGATVQISGTASPLSLVDIFLDNQVAIVRGSPVYADAAGNFSYSGPLPAGTVTIYAASTLADPMYPNRAGSSSQWAGPAPVIVAGGEPLLAATGRVVDLSGPAGGPAHASDVLRFTVTITNVGQVDVTNIGSTVFQTSPSVAIWAGSGKMLGQGMGFVATDVGFSNGTLAPGQVATFQIDSVVKPVTAPSLARYSLEVNGAGIVAIPTGALMPIAGGAPAPQPRLWVPLISF